MPDGFAFSHAVINLSADAFHEYSLLARFPMFAPMTLLRSGFCCRYSIASHMCDGDWLGRTMPKSFEGISSEVPPTFVIIGVVQHAAASSSEVEKPSDLLGRQNASA